MRGQTSHTHTVKSTMSHARKHVYREREREGDTERERGRQREREITNHVAVLGRYAFLELTI